MSVETLVRAWVLARYVSAELRWAQGFTGPGLKKESARQMETRLRLSIRKAQQSVRFREAALKRLGLSPRLWTA